MNTFSAGCAKIPLMRFRVNYLYED